VSGAICGGGTWGRGMFHCPFCGGRRRGLQRLVFGGYGSDSVCGGCGAWFSGGEGRKPGKREGARNRGLVKATWPRVRGWRVVFRETLEGK